MDFLYFVGWDVSQQTLNYCLRDANRTILAEGVLDNKAAAIQAQLNKWSEEFDHPICSFLHCLEKTGHYCNPMLSLLEPMGLNIWLEDAVQLKQSMGRRKDKTDKADARMISEYAVNQHYKAKIKQPIQAIEVHLSDLNTARLKLVSMRQALFTAEQEKRKYHLFDLDPILGQTLQQTVEHLDQQIEAINQRVIELIEQDEQAKRKLEIAKSIPGIGPKNVIAIVAITGMFNKISTAGACASYAGITPHLHQSGSSLKRAARVSRAANKALKSAFHQGAQFLIQHPSPFKAIYDRLREKGKTYRQAINAVRNKMIRVLYACLEKDVIYDKKHHNSLA